MISINNKTGVITLIDPTNATRTQVGAQGEDLATVATTFFVGVLLPPPPTVTPLQIRKAIRNAPSRATLLSKITALTEEQKEEWEFALVIDRNNAAIKGLALTEIQLDNLFRLAATF